MLLDTAAVHPSADLLQGGVGILDTTPYPRESFGCLCEFCSYRANGHQTLDLGQVVTNDSYRSQEDFALAPYICATYRKISELKRLADTGGSRGYTCYIVSPALRSDRTAYMPISPLILEDPHQIKQ